MTSALSQRNPVTARSTPSAIRLSASVPLRLDSREGWWLVESGNVDMFAVMLKNGRPTGIRHPLGRMALGGLIAGLPQDSRSAVIAVGHLGTSVVALADEDVSTWSYEEQADRIDRWLCLIANAIFGDGPSWPEIAQEAGHSVKLAAGKEIYIARGVAWVVGCSGTFFIGNLRFSSPAAAPIAGGLSVKADTDCTLDLIATADALQRGLKTTGLAAFHAVFLSGLAKYIMLSDEAAGRRVAARDQANRRSLRAAVERLAGVTAGEQPVYAAKLSVDDPTLAAFSIVAAHQGIELTRIARGVTGTDPLMSDFAGANGVGLRQVMLRGTWWRSDNGPLLASRGEAKRPVALLPIGRRGYRLWDPADGSSVAVDDAIAAEIAPQAVMAYRPIPPHTASPAALIGFAYDSIRGELATIIAASTLVGAVGALLPIATGFLFGSAIPRGDDAEVLTVIAGLALAALGASVFDLTSGVALVRLRGRFEQSTQPALINRLLGLPANFFRRFDTGELTNRVLSVQSMRRLLADNTLVSFLAGLYAVASFGVILIYSPLLALVGAALAVLGALVNGALSIGELRHERARIALRGREDSLLVQIIQGIAKLRVAAGESRAFGLWASLFALQKRRLLRRQQYASLGALFGEIYPILGTLALFLAVSRLLSPGGSAQPALSLSGFLAVNAAFGQLFAANTALVRASTTMLGVIPLFDRLRPILAAEPELRPDQTEAGPLSGHIELSHVSFRYAEGSRLVLDDVSLRIEPGQFVAFVGQSGCGKSTLLRLLLGFERPESGDILYDGQSIGTLDLVSLRRQIGVVLQHSRIATGTIFDNIAGGRPCSLDDVWTAARLAGLDGDIEAMPMGMHTLLIEGSVTLSGGQRQRLMIARALIGKPRLLFFDEATSALDNRTQSVVIQSLERLRTTRVVVAHRLSTLEHADRIFVLAGGQLVESGGFGELIAQHGAFSRLVQRQTL